MMHQLLTTGDLAARWQLSPRTLQRWRLRQKGPLSCRIGRAVRYRIDDVLAFEAQHCFQDEPGILSP